MNVGDRVTIISGGFAGLPGKVLDIRSDMQCICMDCDEWCELEVTDNSGVWSGSFCFHELEVQK